MKVAELVGEERVDLELPGHLATATLEQRVGCRQSFTTPFRADTATSQDRIPEREAVNHTRS